MGSHHSHDHSHHSRDQNQRSLLIALGLTSVFLVVEVVGGIVSGSLALLSDAAHMLTDSMALVFSLAAIQMAKYPANAKKTFGYHRTEILASALNAIMLFVVAAYIVVEAYHRLHSPVTIQSNEMLFIALGGLVVNLICMKVLRSGSDHSLNLKSAYLEVWSDMLGSLGVIIAATIIYFTGLLWVDSAIAIAIGLWILPRAWDLLKESFNILLEGVPKGINLKEVEQAIKSVTGVVSIHDLHIWALTSGKISLTAHVVYDNAISEPIIGETLQRLLHDRFGVSHSTLQCERNPCVHAEKGCHL